MGYKFDIKDTTGRYVYSGDEIEILYKEDNSKTRGKIIYEDFTFKLQCKENKYDFNDIINLYDGRKIRVKILNLKVEKKRYNSIKDQLDDYKEYWNSKERIEIEKIQELSNLQLQEIIFYGWGFAIISFIAVPLLKYVFDIVKVVQFILKLFKDFSFDKLQYTIMPTILFGGLGYFILYIIIFMIYSKLNMDEGIINRKILIKKKKEIVENSIYN